MEPIWNIGYSPEFQPIEAVFSKVKRVFNSQRLNNLVNKTGFNPKPHGRNTMFILKFKQKNSFFEIFAYFPPERAISSLIR